MMVTKAVADENINKANQRASELGWELLNIRMLTNNPEDHYLMVTRCKVKDNEWAVHLYNSDIDGFAEGYYTDSRDDSIDKYWDKR